LESSINQLEIAMQANVHPTLALALLPMAPAGSVVHTIVEANRLQADLHNNALKNSGELQRRSNEQAMRLQVEQPLFGVRS
jgi:hypothetical protein